MRALELVPYAVCSQGFVVQTSLALIAGSFMIHHCANTITAAGVGNGSTLVICMGIITGPWCWDGAAGPGVRMVYLPLGVAGVMHGMHMQCLC